ncbi:MAG: DUF177 domain-containing protein [Pontixanthobacter sp.]
MKTGELHRPIKIKAITESRYDITASEAERGALAKRFDVPAIGRLRAVLTVTPDGEAIAAVGTLAAAWTQSCAVSGEDFAVTDSEELSLRFVPARRDYAPDEELELSADDLDELEYDGDSFDLGEAVAQSFGLMIDPYATGPAAGTARKNKNLSVEGEHGGPLAEMLAALKR